MIQQVEDERLRMLLIYKYLEGRTTAQLTDTFLVDRSTIYHWHRQAISQITLPEDAIIARTRF